jgi:hypothetical protein
MTPDATPPLSGEYNSVQHLIKAVREWGYSFLVPGTASAVAVGLAAFPAVYALDPTLANHGFWHDRRWAIFSIWLIALFGAAYKVAKFQFAEDKATRISNELGQALLNDHVQRAVNGLEDAAVALRRETDRFASIMANGGSKSRIAAIGHRVRSMHVEWELQNAIVRAEKVNSRLSLLQVLDDKRLYAIYAITEEGRTQQIVYPECDAGNLRQSSEYHILADLCQVVKMLRERASAMVRVIEEPYRGTLPGSWKHASHCVVCPVPIGGVPIGVVVVGVCLNKNDPLVEIDIIQQCLNLVDEVKGPLRKFTDDILREDGLNSGEETLE